MLFTLKPVACILVRLASVAVEDFAADTESSEISLRNMSQPGCLEFQYGSTNAADAFELKIAVINDRTRTYLHNVTVSGRYLKLCFNTKLNTFFMFPKLTILTISLQRLLPNSCLDPTQPLKYATIF